MASFSHRKPVRQLESSPPFNWNGMEKATQLVSSRAQTLVRLTPKAKVVLTGLYCFPLTMRLLSHQQQTFSLLTFLIKVIAQY